MDFMIRPLNFLQNCKGESSVYLKQLMLYLDDKIIRCHGRISHSTLSTTSKNPVLLPPNHYFIELFIKERLDGTL